MAIYSSVPPPNQADVNAQLSAADIEAWTLTALQSLSVSSDARGTGVTLSIPLETEKKKEEAAAVKAAHKPRREALQRDSQRRRELLLKGKEGSRRRQRWENDHLLHVPNAQPPLPSDWEVHPVYPVHTVPYYLAPLWENGVRHRAEEVAAAKKKSARKSARKAAGITSSSDDENDTKGKVPSELRQKLKKSKGAKSLLQDLESEIRSFVQEWEAANAKLGSAAVGLELDSDDEEIVFVGKNCTMSDEQRKTVEEELEREKLIFDSLVDDHGASFGRWLVHSIATYYGLTSRSVTNGQRREAYVGIKAMKTGRRDSGVAMELPRPLWGLI